MDELGLFDEPHGEHSVYSLRFVQVIARIRVDTN